MDREALVIPFFAAARLVDGFLTTFRLAVLVDVVLPLFVLDVYFFVVVAVLFASGVAVTLAEGARLEAGFAFSFDVPFILSGANFTFPDGPFGRTKLPFSVPAVIARLSWLVVVALIAS